MSYLLGNFRKLKTMIKYFNSSDKNWRLPRKSDVLIYDAAGQAILSIYLKKWNPEILHTRNETINVPIILKSLFRRGGRLNAYADCYIEQVNPKVVITHIDNNSNFYFLSKRYPSLVTIFLQNGLRSYYLDVFETLDKQLAFKSEFKVDWMGTFGNYIGDEYKKYINGEIYPIGSVKNNSIPKVALKRKGVMSFISQFRNEENLIVDGELVTREEYFQSSDRSILQFLVKYAKKNKRELQIITYNKQDSILGLEEEKKYYNNIAGCDLTFSVRIDDFSSYQTVDTAEVTIGIDSSLAYESAVRGNKTAFFSIRGHFLKRKGYDFGWPATLPYHGPFWSNIPDEILFESILDHLFEINEEEWVNEMKKNDFARIMRYDPENTILNSYLNQILVSK